MTTARTWFDDLFDLSLPTDPGWQRDFPFMRDWCQVRYDTVKRVNAQTIVEIGVRTGFSAFAMLSANPEAQYIGIDPYDILDYSTKDVHFAQAKKALERFPNAQILLLNSQHLTKLPIENADLVHVDGAHGTREVFHDCEIAKFSGAKWLLIDDVAGIPIVRIGAEQFCVKHGYTPELVSTDQQGAWLVKLRE